MGIEKQDEAIGTYNNLVIEVEEDKPAQAYILTYKPDEGGLKSVDEHDSFSFEGTVTGFPIQYDTTDLVNSRQILVITVTYCNYGGSEHLAGGNCTPSYMYSISYVLSARDGGGIHVEEHQAPPNPGFGGGSGGVPTVPVWQDDEDVVEKVDAVILALKIEDRLQDKVQRMWLKGETLKTLKIYEFLAENHFSNESITFAKEAVEALMEDEDNEDNAIEILYELHMTMEEDKRGKKPVKEYLDKCQGFVFMWNNYPNNEVYSYLAKDNKLLVVKILGEDSGKVPPLYNYSGTSYYVYPKSEGAPSLNYTGMITAPNYYFIPIKASVHTHTPCRNDGTTGFDHEVGADDKALATENPGIKHYVIGCTGIARFNTSENFFDKKYGLLSDLELCNKIN